MHKIDPEVLQAINEFVSQGQSFVSLDIYSKLGIRINDEEYPIYEQVKDAYVAGLMPNYLAKLTPMTLERGSEANLWKYYLPQTKVTVVPLVKRSDGKVELTKEALGHFPLLDSSIGISVNDHKITLGLDLDNCTKVIENLDKRVRLNKSLLEEANLLNDDILIARVYPNRIEITGN